MHTVLKLYDRLCAAEGGGFVVRRKAHAGGGGRRKPQAQVGGRIVNNGHRQ